jgi:hypothetical protein
MILLRMGDPGSSQKDPEPNRPPSGRDCFGPPPEPCECYCLHCGRVFMSDQIWFQKVIGSRDGFDGFWMCPTPNCGGAGFTFDIFPTDPEHTANDGWEYWDDPEEDDDGEKDEEAEWDPEEPHFAAMDEWDEEDDNDLEGEEWKYGLEPGEKPPEPPWANEARRAWEEEQKKYDQPDERPRVLDWTNKEDNIREDDIPF